VNPRSRTASAVVRHLLADATGQHETAVLWTGELALGGARAGSGGSNQLRSIEAAARLTEQQALQSPGQQCVAEARSPCSAAFRR